MDLSKNFLTFLIIGLAIIIGIIVFFVIANLDKNIIVKSYDGNSTFNLGKIQTNDLQNTDSAGINFTVTNPDEFLENLKENDSYIETILVNGKEVLLFNCDNYYYIAYNYNDSGTIYVENLINFATGVYAIPFVNTSYYDYNGSIINWSNINILKNGSLDTPKWLSYQDLKQFYQNINQDLVQFDDENQIIRLKAYQVRGSNYSTRLTQSYVVTLTCSNDGIIMSQVIDD